MLLSPWKHIVQPVLTICFVITYTIFTFTACAAFFHHGSDLEIDPFGAASNWWTTGFYSFGLMLCFVIQWSFQRYYVSSSDIMETEPETTITSAESANTETLTPKRCAFLSTVCNTACDVIYTLMELMVFPMVFPFWSLSTIYNHPDVTYQFIAIVLQSLMVYLHWMASFCFGDWKLFTLSTWIAVVSTYIYVELFTFLCFFMCSMAMSPKKADDEDNKTDGDDNKTANILVETRITIGEQSDSDSFDSNQNKINLKHHVFRLSLKRSGLL